MRRWATSSCDAGRRRQDGFPWAQLLAISSCTLAWAVAIFSLSTYMGVYVQDLLGLPSLDMAGYYSSFLLGSFTLGNLMSSFAWGVIADRFGRKPVMLFNVCATGVLAITFGLSRTFSSALVSRFLFGLSTCVVPIAKIMIAELLGPEKAVIGMTFIPGTRAVGTIIGPAIGGLLVQPAVLYPSSFSSTGLFARYPFLLPNLAVALLAFGTLPLVLVVLPETLSVKRVGVVAGESTYDIPSADLSRHEGGGVVVSSRPDGIMLVDSPDCVSSSPQGSPRDLRSEGRHTLGELGLAVAASHRSDVEDTEIAGNKTTTEGLERGRPTAAFLGRRGQRQSIGESAGGGIVGQTPLQQQQLQPGDAAKGGSSSLWGQGGLLSPWRVRLLLLLTFVVSTIDLGFFQTYPLWLLASKDAGGLEWSVSKIGKVLGGSGIGIMLFQFVVYPALVRTIGIVWLVRGSGVLGAFLFFVIPDFQRLGWSENASSVVAVAVVILVGSCMSVVETAISLAWTNSVPAHVRGKVGGVFAVAMGLGSVIGPPGLSSLMAWSLQAPNGRGNSGLVDYHAVFVVEAVVMVVITVLGREAMTLESLTLPIENRREMEYNSLSQSSEEAETPSAQSLAVVAATTRGIEKGQRRRNPWAQ